MNITVSTSHEAAEEPLLVPHFVKGQLIVGTDRSHFSRDLGANFYTPATPLNDLFWPRSQPLPAADLKVAEVIELLAAVGERLHLDRNEWLQQALEASIKVSPLGRRILENCYRDIGRHLSPPALNALIQSSYRGNPAIDGWSPERYGERSARVRAFPPRLVHILAGNSPMVAAMTVARGALTRGVNLLKLPSNDLFTVTAILRTLAEIAPDHPTTQSFAAVYWKGGDESTESILFRAQYFDKLVAWGGDASIRHILKYLGPGLELIAFDPKVSISMIGREAFASSAVLDDVARRGASDVMGFNQDACNCSRYQFIEGSVAQVDDYCERLHHYLGQNTLYGDGQAAPTPADIRGEVEVLRQMEPVYRVFGTYDGTGLVIRSDEPVDFHPSGKTVNVVMVNNLNDGVAHTTVATQTVGVYPAARKRELRDRLASAGAQRITTLGEVNMGVPGTPHDAFYPMHRFMRWVVDEGDEV